MWQFEGIYILILTEYTGCLIMHFGMFITSSSMIQSFKAQVAGPTCKSIFLQGIPKPDFLFHSVRPELHDCTRIPLAHPLQSID